MIRHAYACPPDAELARSLEADTDSEGEVAGHLESCPVCRARLDRLAAGGSDWLLSPPRSEQAHPALADALRALVPPPEPDDEPAALPPDFLDAPATPDGLGSMGRYEVTKVLGRGGNGVVLKAIDPDLMRPVAVKVLDPLLGANGTARERFAREGRAAAAVAHENVVGIFAVEKWKGLPYLVMEYLAGGSLQDRLDRDGPLPWREVASVGRQLAAGLSAAHAQGVIHRDVKPANALAEGPGGRVKLTDFGLCRAAHEASLTRSGAVAGTPLYMSPEQARGDSLDHRSDLFSLGAVLYALATGVPPFRAPHPIGVLNRVLKDRPVPPRKLMPDLPRSLEGVVMRLLEKSPPKRPADAAEVERLLASVLAEPEPRKPVRRRGFVLAATLGLFAAALAVTLIKLTTPHGVLVVEADDPDVTVTLDGTDVIVTGAGPHEVRLKPGAYTLRAGKDGKEVRSEALTIERGGKRLVRITLEPLASAKAGEGARVAEVIPGRPGQGGPKEADAFRAEFAAALEQVRNWQKSRKIDPTKPPTLPGNFELRLTDAWRAYHEALAPHPSAPEFAKQTITALAEFDARLAARPGGSAFLKSADGAKLRQAVEVSLEMMSRAANESGWAVEASGAEAIKEARTGGPADLDPERTQKARQALRSAIRDIGAAFGGLTEAADQAERAALGGPTPKEVDPDERRFRNNPKRLAEALRREFDALAARLPDAAKEERADIVAALSRKAEQYHAALAPSPSAAEVAARVGQEFAEFQRRLPGRPGGPAFLKSLEGKRLLDAVDAGFDAGLQPLTRADEALKRAVKDALSSVAANAAFGGNAEIDPDPTQLARQGVRDAIRALEDAMFGLKEAATEADRAARGFGPTPKVIDRSVATDRLDKAIRSVLDWKKTRFVPKLNDLPADLGEELRAAFRDSGLAILGEADPVGRFKSLSDRVSALGARIKTNARIPTAEAMLLRAERLAAGLDPALKAVEAGVERAIKITAETPANSPIESDPPVAFIPRERLARALLDVERAILDASVAADGPISEDEADRLGAALRRTIEARAEAARRTKSRADLKSPRTPSQTPTAGKPAANFDYEGVYAATLPDVAGFLDQTELELLASPVIPGTVHSRDRLLKAVQLLRDAEARRRDTALSPVDEVAGPAAPPNLSAPEPKQAREAVRQRYAAALKARDEYRAAAGLPRQPPAPDDTHAERALAEMGAPIGSRFEDAVAKWDELRLSPPRPAAAKAEAESDKLAAETKRLAADWLKLHRTALADASTRIDRARASVPSGPVSDGSPEARLLAAADLLARASTSYAALLNDTPAGGLRLADFDTLQHYQARARLRRAAEAVDLQAKALTTSGDPQPAAKLAQHRADFLKAAADLTTWRAGAEPKIVPPPADIVNRIRLSVQAYQGALCPNPEPLKFAEQMGADVERFQVEFIKRLGGFDPTGEEGLRDDFRARMKVTIRDWMKYRGEEWATAADRVVERALERLLAADSPDNILLDSESARKAREGLAKAIKDVQFAVEAYKSDAEMVLRPREAFLAAYAAARDWHKGRKPGEQELPGELRRRVEDTAKSYHYALAVKPSADEVAAKLEADLEGLTTRLKQLPGGGQEFFDLKYDRSALLAKARQTLATLRTTQAAVKAAFDSAIEAVTKAVLTGAESVEVDPEATRKARQARKKAIDDALGAAEDFREEAQKALQAPAVPPGRGQPKSNTSKTTETGPQPELPFDEAAADKKAAEVRKRFDALADRYVQLQLQLNKAVTDRDEAAQKGFEAQIEQAGGRLAALQVEYERAYAAFALDTEGFVEGLRLDMLEADSALHRPATGSATVAADHYDVAKARLVKTLAELVEAEANRIGAATRSHQPGGGGRPTLPDLGSPDNRQARERFGLALAAVRQASSDYGEAAAKLFAIDHPGMSLPPASRPVDDAVAEADLLKKAAPLRAKHGELADRSIVLAERSRELARDTTGTSGDERAKVADEAQKLADACGSLNAEYMALLRKAAGDAPAVAERLRSEANEIEAKPARPRDEAEAARFAQAKKNLFAGLDLLQAADAAHVHLMTHLPSDAVPGRAWLPAPDDVRVREARRRVRRACAAVEGLAARLREAAKTGEPASAGKVAQGFDEAAAEKKAAELRKSHDDLTRRRDDFARQRQDLETRKGVVDVAGRAKLIDEDARIAKEIRLTVEAYRAVYKDALPDADSYVENLKLELLETESDLGKGLRGAMVVGKSPVLVGHADAADLIPPYKFARAQADKALELVKAAGEAHAATLGRVPTRQLADGTPVWPDLGSPELKAARERLRRSHAAAEKVVADFRDVVRAVRKLDAGK